MEGTLGNNDHIVIRKEFFSHVEVALGEVHDYDVNVWNYVEICIKDIQPIFMWYRLRALSWTDSGLRSFKYNAYILIAEKFGRCFL